MIVDLEPMNACCYSIILAKPCHSSVELLHKLWAMCALTCGALLARWGSNTDVSASKGKMYTQRQCPRSSVHFTLA